MKKEVSIDLMLQLVRGAVTFKLHHQALQDRWGSVKACFLLHALHYLNKTYCFHSSCVVHSIISPLRSQQSADLCVYVGFMSV